MPGTFSRASNASAVCMIEGILAVVLMRGLLVEVSNVELKCLGQALN